MTTNDDTFSDNQETDFDATDAAMNKVLNDSPYFVGKKTQDQINMELDDFKTAMSKLNDKDKQALGLVCQGYTQREIGEKLGVSHVAVLKRIKKIEKILAN